MSTDNNIIPRILKHDLCIGCGLCSSILGQDTCKMVLAEDGFYRPEVKEDTDDQIVKRICPGIRVHGKGEQDIWGEVERVVEGWAKDSKLRHKAASGGIVSSLAIYMLESGCADAVLQVGVKNDSYLYNELKISRNKEEITHNAQSRYAPALSLFNIKQILDESEDKFVFIGKPCDIAGMKNLIELYPIYNDRFVLFISIFCAGMPSYKATEKAWKQSGRHDEPNHLKYRGDGWPGYFRATWNDGDKYELSYDESWGNILGRDLGFRCKVCPDGIGMLADVAVGDSWNTKDGYPDFTEAEGRCFVFVRTKRGHEILEKAKSGNYLVFHELDIEKIKEMQSYQYNRRKLIGWRLAPLKFLEWDLIDFRGLSIIKQARTASLRQGIQNMKGSFNRLYIIKKNGKR